MTKTFLNTSLVFVKSLNHFNISLYSLIAMKEEKIITNVKVCQLDELPEADRKLIEKAKEATANSYAPYSRFHVGAAILMDNGEIVCGANQENAAFSSGTCAERSACFYASARYPGVRMRKIAIAAWTRLHHSPSDPDADCFQPSPISPCGSCRQSLLEYEALYGDIEVLLYGKDKTYILPSIKSLMPLSFTEF
ncbi:MAG: cytidine deaminase [Lachnospiraceae bacterium]|nr:cytidine deaminase [Lachnospiraceae bacterium]